jgi:hypothetical protein
MAHKLIAWCAFCSLLVLNLLSVIGEIRTDQEKLTAVKLSIVAVSGWNLFGLAAISRVDVNELQFNLLGIFEYVVLIGVVVGTALYYFNFRKFKVLFCVEMPEEDETEKMERAESLIEGEVEEIS